MHQSLIIPFTSILHLIFSSSTLNHTICSSIIIMFLEVYHADYGFAKQDTHQIVKHSNTPVHTFYVCGAWDVTNFKLAHPRRNIAEYFPTCGTHGRFQCRAFSWCIPSTRQLWFLARSIIYLAKRSKPGIQPLANPNLAILPTIPTISRLAPE